MNSAAARRLVVGVLVPLALLATGIVPILVAWGRLPDRLATHWNLHGTADGSMTRPIFVALMATIIVACGVWLAIAAWRRQRTAALASSAALAAGIGAVFSGAALVTVAANVDRLDWRATRGPSLVAIVVIVGASLALAALVARLLSHGVIEAAPLPGEPLELPAGARAAWLGRCTSPLLAGTSALGALVGLGMVIVGPLRAVGAAVLVVGLLVSLLASIVVRADHRGATVVYGPLHIVRQRIPLERIASARAIDVAPLRWGGWGYRGSLRILRRAAVVLRRGPGLRLDLADGSVFVVTVDDPDGAAAVLTRYLRDRAGQGSWSATGPS